MIIAFTFTILTVVDLSSARTQWNAGSRTGIEEVHATFSQFHAAFHGKKPDFTLKFIENIHLTPRENYGQKISFTYIRF